MGQLVSAVCLAFLSPPLIVGGGALLLMVDALSAAMTSGAVLQAHLDRFFIFRGLSDLFLGTGPTLTKTWIMACTYGIGLLAPFMYLWHHRLTREGTVIFLVAVAFLHFVSGREQAGHSLPCNTALALFCL